MIYRVSGKAKKRLRARSVSLIWIFNGKSYFMRFFFTRSQFLFIYFRLKEGNAHETQCARCALLLFREAAVFVSFSLSVNVYRGRSSTPEVVTQPTPLCEKKTKLTFLSHIIKVKCFVSALLMWKMVIAFSTPYLQVTTEDEKNIYNLTFLPEPWMCVLCCVSVCCSRILLQSKQIEFHIKIYFAILLFLLFSLHSSMYRWLKNSKFVKFRSKLWRKTKEMELTKKKNQRLNYDDDVSIVIF